MPVPSSRPRVIFISGHYRDQRGEFYVRCNIREAERAALFVWMNGGVALCPHKNTAGLGGAYNIPDDTWLNGDLELLLRCDGVYAIPGWDTSVGALKEVDFAVLNKIPVAFDQAQVLDILEGESDES